jgi:hypothetical protein
VIAAVDDLRSFTLELEEHQGMSLLVQRPAEESAQA